MVCGMFEGLLELVIGERFQFFDTTQIFLSQIKRDFFFFSLDTGKVAGFFTFCVFFTKKLIVYRKIDFYQLYIFNLKIEKLQNDIILGAFNGNLLNRVDEKSELNKIKSLTTELNEVEVTRLN